jgi:hypothetical protein
MLIFPWRQGQFLASHGGRGSFEFPREAMPVSSFLGGKRQFLASKSGKQASRGSFWLPIEARAGSSFSQGGNDSLFLHREARASFFLASVRSHTSDIALILFLLRTVDVPQLCTTLSLLNPNP